jgi:hypothetical protein
MNSSALQMLQEEFRRLRSIHSALLEDDILEIERELHKRKHK